MQARVALFVCAGLVAGLAPARIVRADAATEEARQHYLKGNQLFDVGRWDEAAEEYEKAYALRSDPSFLYNMAQAYRRKGDAKRAIDLYKNYLMKAPKSPQRAEVEERIRALQKQIDDAEASAKAAGAPSGAATPALQPAPPTAQPALPAAPAAGPSVAPTSSPGGPSVAPTEPASGLAAPAAPAYYGPAQGAPPSPAYGPAPESATAQAAPPATATSATAPWGPPGPVSSPPAPQPSYLRTPVKTRVATNPGAGLRVGGIVCGVTGAAAVGAGIVFGVLTKSYSDSVQSGSVFNPSFDRRGKLYETLQWVGYGAGAGLIATGAILYGIGATTGTKASVAFAPLPGGAGVSAGGAF